MASIFGKSTVEEPNHKVVRKSDGYEVREYAPQVRAIVSMEGGMDKNMGNAFRALAGYIFGGNTGREASAASQKIAMTAPVAVTTTPHKIAMTAPVAMQPAGGEGAGAEGMTMSFVMPSQYTKVEQLPAPKDARVTLVEVPAHEYAVIRFSWYPTEKQLKKHEAQLREAAARDGLQLSSDPAQVQLWAYNPPWTLPWWRRNEVAVPVLKA